MLEIDFLLYFEGDCMQKSGIKSDVSDKFLSFSRTLPPWEYKDYLGWMEQGDGKLAYGVFVQNGRIKGDAKKALRQVIERYELPVIITPNQNLVLTEIEPSWKSDILNTLNAAGVRYFYYSFSSSQTPN